jgi:multiple sugar transport system substrate-binding protein
VVISLILSACTTTSEPQAAQPSGEKVTLTLYTNWAPTEEDKGSILLDAIKEFEAANPGVEIKEEIIPDTDMATKVETAFLANKEPDIILHNWLGPSKDWLSDGVVIPVTPYIKDWGFEGKFKEAALNNYRVGDEIAAFPLEGFNWPIWYNMEILEKAGVKDIPTTWDELIDVAQKVREAGYQPFALGGKDWTGGDWFLTAITAALGNDQTSELFNGGFSQNADAKAFVGVFVKLRD